MAIDIMANLPTNTTSRLKYANALTDHLSLVAEVILEALLLFVPLAHIVRG
jgi:hypothetical protein